MFKIMSYQRQCSYFISITYNLRVLKISKGFCVSVILVLHFVNKLNRTPSTIFLLQLKWSSPAESGG